MLNDRVLFPVEGSLEPDANNVAGIRRRLQERGVGAGDVLVVTNTYRPGGYVDHEGEPMDVFVFGRKFLVNADAVFVVEGVEDCGSGIVLCVVEYPCGVKHRIVVRDVEGYALADAVIVGVDGVYYHSPFGSVVGKYFVHVSRAEVELIERVHQVWDVQEEVAQTVNRCLPVVRGGLLSCGRDLKLSMVNGCEEVAVRGEGLVGRLGERVCEGYGAVLKRMEWELGVYRRYVGAVGVVSGGDWGVPPVVGEEGCVLALPDGTTVCVGEFVATRLDYYKSRGRYLPPTEPRHVFVSRVDGIDMEEQSASLVFDTGDCGTLTFDEEGTATICYAGRTYRLRTPVALARGASFGEANRYASAAYVAESRKTHLANLADDHFTRNIGENLPVPVEVTDYLHSLRTLDNPEGAYKKARKAVLAAKRTQLEQVANSPEVTRWRELWNNYTTRVAAVQEALNA